MAKLELEIHQLAGFTPSQEKKYREALDLMLRAVNSIEFHKWFVSNDTIFEPFASAYNKWSVNPNGPNRQDMYERIINGKDIYGTIDGDMDLDVKAYNSFWSMIVGYTYMSDMRIFENMKFIKKYALPDIAGHVFHEYLHNQGYMHHTNPFASGIKETVPYKCGYKIAEIARGMLTPVEPIKRVSWWTALRSLFGWK